MLPNTQPKNFQEYEQLYKKSIQDPEAFWAEQAEKFYWQKKWSCVREYNFDHTKAPISIRWFKDAETNITYNCLDKNLEKNADKIALIWEGNNPNESKKITYRELFEEVCKCAVVLKKLGLKKGDRVAVYLPMVPELAITLLACARLGVIHSVVFGGFSPVALADRILDSKCKILITADGTYRGDKIVPLKQNADEAMKLVKKNNFQVEKCLVVHRLPSSPTQMDPAIDLSWEEEMKKISSAEIENEKKNIQWMNAEDPLFILYTSGSTGKPKGVLHTTGGYMVYAATTFQHIFDYKENDIYFCTADIGWITGHSYVLYGPLLNGATTLLFEGIPTWPDPGRFWNIVDKYNVSILYTAPTAIRSLEALGDEWVKKYSRKSLRLLGTVGEPINPAAWNWYNEIIGEKRCPIVDTWWQTETGGILISPIPGKIPTKPGSATLPFFGIEPAILDPQTGKILEGECSGVLVLKTTWPGQMRTVFGDHARFEKTYFHDYHNYYFTGDGCKRDSDGYYWITGRIDDVINVSGHRFGTAEIESAIVSCPGVVESAVVGYPHDRKGQGIYAYVTLSVDQEYSEPMKKKILAQVRKMIGAIAIPDKIHWAPALPKTRSGKIMRRILRKIAANELEQIGDISTLADPSIVEKLLNTRPHD